MKRPGGKSEPGSHADERRRQFEESRGLTEREELDLGDAVDDEGERTEPPTRSEPSGDKEPER